MASAGREEREDRGQRGEGDHRQEEGVEEGPMTYRLNMATACFYKDGFTGISVQVLTEML